MITSSKNDDFEDFVELLRFPIFQQNVMHNHGQFCVALAMAFNAGIVDPEALAQESGIGVAKILTAPIVSWTPEERLKAVQAIVTIADKSPVRQDTTPRQKPGYTLH